MASPDKDDAFPRDPKEKRDSDGDGIGDHADMDDDNDGVPDEDALSSWQERGGNLWDPLEGSLAPKSHGWGPTVRRASGFPLFQFFGEALRGEAQHKCRYCQQGWPSGDRQTKVAPTLLCRIGPPVQFTPP